MCILTPTDYAIEDWKKAIEMQRKRDEKFNLSEKITDAVVGYERVSVATTKDVKEFIKILLQAEREGLNMKEVIEKNAGEKLLEKQGEEK